MSSTTTFELRNVTKQFGSQRPSNQVDLVLKGWRESVGMAGTQRCRQIYHYEAGYSGLITPTEGEVMFWESRPVGKAGRAASQPNRLPA